MHEPYKQIKFHPSKIYSENPKKLNQSFNAFQMSFRKTDQNGGAQGKIKQVFKVEKLIHNRMKPSKLIHNRMKPSKAFYT